MGIKVVFLSSTITAAQRCTSSSGTETINFAISSICLGWQLIHNPPCPLPTCWQYSHFTDHCVTSLCKHVRLCLYVTGHDACQQLASCDRFFFWVPVVTKAFSDRAEERQTEQRRWTECESALPWSFRCDATRDLVQPWEGFWSSASWSSGQPETGSSSCGWRCLWNGAWKYRRNTTDITFKVMVHISPVLFLNHPFKHKTVLSGQFSPFS